MNTNGRHTAKCPTCEVREDLTNPHLLCRKGEDTGYRVPEAQVVINFEPEQIVRRASWGWKNP